jgi:DDE superfamily endonuclease
MASLPEGREIHIVADNLSAHKTKSVFEFLDANPTVRIHYTPTYSSWLNQVEIWFSKIQRDVIARGIFTSATDLSRKVIRYIKQYNKTATPFPLEIQQCRSSYQNYQLNEPLTHCTRIRAYQLESVKKSGVGRSE